MILNNALVWKRHLLKINSKVNDFGGYLFDFNSSYKFFSSINMFQRRKISQSSNKKSKLVLNRPIINQQSQLMRQSCQLLRVIPLVISHNQRVSPFRIRTSISSNKNRQLPVHDDFLEPQDKKEEENHKISQKLKKTTSEKENCVQIGIQNVQMLEAIINQSISKLIQAQILKERNKHYIMSPLFLRQFLLQFGENFNQARFKIQNSIKKLIDKNAFRIQNCNSFKDLKHHERQQAFKIQQNLNICQNLRKFSQKQRTMKSLKSTENMKTSSITSLKFGIKPQENENTSKPIFQDRIIKTQSLQQLTKNHIQEGQSTQLRLLSKETQNIFSVTPILNIDRLQNFKQTHSELIKNYINTQPNKIVQMASVYHKDLQEEMFTYADLLRTNRFGTNTYIMNTNVSVLDKLIDKDLVQVNKRLIEGKEQTTDKLRIMGDFVVRTRQRYDDLVNPFLFQLKELMGVIDKKTENCRKFVSLISKWQENYLARSEYLSNLKEDYCQQLYNLYSQFKIMLRKFHSPQFQQVNDIIKCSLKRIAKMDELVLIGNSFY